MRASHIAIAITTALAIGSAGSAAAAGHHHKVRATAATSAPGAANMAAELAMRDREIAELKDALAAVTARVEEIDQRTDAQSDVNIATAKDVETLQASAKKTDKIEKLVNDTSVTGRVFVDLTDLSVEKNGTKTAASGVGLDVKRGYISVSHAFNNIWSANITTDFNYTAVTGETQLFIKKAYLQGKFNDAAILRVGSADLPWVPFTENFYGFRYVENIMIDKSKFGTSADWGVHMGGQFDGGTVNYAVSAVNGGGYKNPTRTNRMDFEGRLGFVPMKNTVIAIGGYTGTLGKETRTTDAMHTADRLDLLAAYAKDSTRLGVEFFSAKNWNNVLTPASDKAHGFSLWGSYGLGPKATVFARYDRVKPSKTLDPSLTDRYFNIGVEFPVYKGVKLAAVYKNDQLKDNVNETKTNEFGIWGDVSF